MEEFFTGQSRAAFISTPFFPLLHSLCTLGTKCPRNIKILLSALLFQSYHQVVRVMGRVLGAMTVPGSLSSNINTQRAFPCGSAGKESACNAGDLGWEDPLEKGKATHSSIPAWRIVHGVAESRTRLSDFQFLSLSPGIKCSRKNNTLFLYSRFLQWFRRDNT